MKDLFKVLFSTPRSFFFNIRMLPLIDAIKMPIFMANNVRFRSLSGDIIISDNIGFAKIRIGFHWNEECDTNSTHSYLSLKKGSKLIFRGGTHIGQGAILSLNENSELILGNNFATSGTTKIICSEKISFGNDVQLAWDTLIMDSDSHKIFDEK